MLMTEEQARKKTCPTMRHCTNETAVIQDGNRPMYAVGCCIASECMAWRWESISKMIGTAVNAGDRRPRHEIEASATPRGFCGLAGKVEG